MLLSARKKAENEPERGRLIKDKKKKQIENRKYFYFKVMNVLKKEDKVVSEDSCREIKEEKDKSRLGRLILWRKGTVKDNRGSPLSFIFYHLLIQQKKNK